MVFKGLVRGKKIKSSMLIKDLLLRLRMHLGFFVGFFVLGKTQSHGVSPIQLSVQSVAELATSPLIASTPGDESISL